MQQPKTVLITGGSGLVGTYLIPLLSERGYKIRILSRTEKKIDGAETFLWDINKRYIDERAIVGTDYIVHLAGANISEKPWTEKRKKELYSSRIDSGKLLLKAISQVNSKPETIVCASAIGIYKPSVSPIDENSLLADDFAAGLCKEWEQQNLLFEKEAIRTVILRIGLVMSAKGGFLKEVLKPMKFFMAPVFGEGRQILPCIEINDLCRMIIFSLENKKVSGIYNAVSPVLLTNRDLVTSIQNKIKKPSVKINVPAFFLKMLLGQRSFAILNNYPVLGNKMQKAGFVFNSAN